MKKIYNNSCTIVLIILLLIMKAVLFKKKNVKSVLKVRLIRQFSQI